MSTASTSTSTPRWRYDVFVSFRGEDTRKDFTDHLYAALDRHGIRTFIDDPELQRGKAISPELSAAIEESRFALIVPSENYASSTWCLDELLKILECMEARATVVLPIFYNVDPSDVRKQTGTFEQAFTKQEENFMDDIEKVKAWGDAFKKVANLSGWESKGRYEAKLIINIVEFVWKKLRLTCISHVDDLVGIDSILKPIHWALDAMADDDCFFRIWGMGGIGKTTIARVLYERLISSEFEYRIFVPNVRSNVIAHLQMQILSDIVMEKDGIWDIGKGVSMIKRLLGHKKVLLVLDDVSHLDQLKYLAGNREWFGFGSKVLITSRYKSLLIKHGVDNRFEVEGLNDDEALQLFSLEAFKKRCPKPIHVSLGNRVLKYAEGVPLAIKVLGSFLQAKKTSAWISAWDKLNEICNPKIFDTLKVCYDGLEDDVKIIFLDIACFFNGEAAIE